MQIHFHKWNLDDPNADPVIDEDVNPFSIYWDSDGYVQFVLTDEEARASYEIRVKIDDVAVAALRPTIEEALNGEYAG
jgi:hypothetical protein